MKLYTMTRPSMPLTAACALSATLPVPGATPVVVPVLAAERARVSWAHQVQVQAELAQVQVRIDGTNGSTRFQGLSTTIAARVDSKRYADGASGVPPRGRPV
jgi:hypothetical protein